MRSDSTAPAAHRELGDPPVHSLSSWSAMRTNASTTENLPEATHSKGPLLTWLNSAEAKRASCLN